MENATKKSNYNIGTVAMVVSAILILLILFLRSCDDNTPSQVQTYHQQSVQPDTSQTVFLITPKVVKRSGGKIILDNPHITYIINVKDMDEWRLDYVEKNPQTVDLLIDTEYGVYTKIPQRLEKVDPRTLVLKINTKTPLVFWVL